MPPALQALVGIDGMQYATPLVLANDDDVNTVGYWILTWDGLVWVPTDDCENGPNPPDIRWIIVLVITLSIAIPEAGMAEAAMIIVKKRQAPPEGQPKKLLTQKKLPEDQAKVLKNNLYHHGINCSNEKEMIFFNFIDLFY